MEPSCKRILQKDEFEALLGSEWKDYQTAVEFVLGAGVKGGGKDSKNSAMNARKRVFCPIVYEEGALRPGQPIRCAAEATLGDVRGAVETQFGLSGDEYELLTVTELGKKHAAGADSLSTSTLLSARLFVLRHEDMSAAYRAKLDTLSEPLTLHFTGMAVKRDANFEKRKMNPGIPIPPNAKVHTYEAELCFDPTEEACEANAAFALQGGRAEGEERRGNIRGNIVITDAKQAAAPGPPPPPPPGPAPGPAPAPAPGSKEGGDSTAKGDSAEAEADECVAWTWEKNAQGGMTSRFWDPSTGECQTDGWVGKINPVTHVITMSTMQARPPPLVCM